MSTSRTSSRGPPSPLQLPSCPGSSSSLNAASATLSGQPLPPPVRRSSTSFSQVSEFKLDLDDENNGHSLKGVKHVNLSVDAGEWRHPIFKTKVLSILRQLRIPLWSSKLLGPSSIHLQKVSGALTNAVFFVSFNPNPEPTSPSMSPMLTPTMPPFDPDRPPPFSESEYPPTLLFRIYGPKTDAIIERDEELRVLHVLSSIYGLGPQIYGTFLNGRVEQFFPSRALTAPELREPLVSRGIARRMRELHSVDLKVLGYPAGKEGEPTVWRCIQGWIDHVGDILTTLSGLGGKWELWVEAYGLHRIKEEVATYRSWVEGSEGKGKGVVFSHGDTQYGNLLRLDSQLPPNAPDHHRYIVIDFEYAAPNPRGFDIANHFHEWRANYHHPTHSHSLQPHFPYPNAEQREDFYRAYLSIERENGAETLGRRKDVAAERVARLEEEVRIWSPSCSIFWALWGLVQGEEQVNMMAEGKQDGWEFDYLSYALERLEMFRVEARDIGVPLKVKVNPALEGIVPMIMSSRSQVKGTE